MAKSQVRSKTKMKSKKKSREPPADTEECKSVTKASSCRTIAKGEDEVKPDFVLYNGGHSEPKHYSKISFLDAVFKIDEFVKVTYPADQTYVAKIIHIISKYDNPEFKDLEGKPIILLQR